MANEVLPTSRLKARIEPKDWTGTARIEIPAVSQKTGVATTDLPSGVIGSKTRDIKTAEAAEKVAKQLPSIVPPSTFIPKTVIPTPEELPTLTEERVSTAPIPVATPEPAPPVPEQPLLQPPAAPSPIPVPATRTGVFGGFMDWLSKMDPKTRLAIMATGAKMMEMGGRTYRPEEAPTDLGIAGAAIGQAGIPTYMAQEKAEREAATLEDTMRHRRALEEVAASKAATAADVAEARIKNWDNINKTRNELVGIKKEHLKLAGMDIKSKMAHLENLDERAQELMELRQQSANIDDARLQVSIMRLENEVGMMRGEAAKQIAESQAVKKVQPVPGAVPAPAITGQQPATTAPKGGVALSKAIAAGRAKGWSDEKTISDATSRGYKINYNQ